MKGGLQSKFSEIAFLILTDIPESEGDKENVDDSKESEKNGEEDSKEEDEDPKPRALHKTASIFLRNLAPTITKQEVEAVSLMMLLSLHVYPLISCLTVRIMFSCF